LTYAYGTYSGTVANVRIGISRPTCGFKFYTLTSGAF
jgi:hypothetical protein